jgi:hypothetical protein
VRLLRPAGVERGRLGAVVLGERDGHDGRAEQRERQPGARRRGRRRRRSGKRATNQQDTGFHDHDVSSGAVHVCAGELLEVRLEYDGRKLCRRTVLHPQGSSFDFDASHVHSLGHPLGKAPAVSIHAYSPPLRRMGYYNTGDDGLLRRHWVTYAEETRPDPALAGGLGTRAAS